MFFLLDMIGCKAIEADVTVLDCDRAVLDTCNEPYELCVEAHNDRADLYFEVGGVSDRRYYCESPQDCDEALAMLTCDLCGICDG